jgi:hypothetical protein
MIERGGAHLRPATKAMLKSDEHEFHPTLAVADSLIERPMSMEFSLIDNEHLTATIENAYRTVKNLLCRVARAALSAIAAWLRLAR